MNSTSFSFRVQSSPEANRLAVFSPLYAVAGPLAKALNNAFAATHAFSQDSDLESERDLAERKFRLAGGGADKVLFSLKKILMDLLASSGVDTSRIAARNDLDFGAHYLQGGVRLEGLVESNKLLVNFNFSADGNSPATLAMSFHFGQVETVFTYEGDPKGLDKNRIKKFFDESFKFFEKNGVSGKKATLKF